jgi:DNA-binding NarL/FixJ family response regulator
VVADDQALVRAGFRMILTADGIDVVAEATNGGEAVDAVRRTARRGPDGTSGCRDRWHGSGHQADP